MTGAEGLPDQPGPGSTKEPKNPDSTVDEIAEQIVKYVSWECEGDSPEKLAAVLKRVARLAGLSSQHGASQEGRAGMEFDEPSSTQSPDAGTEALAPSLPESAGAGVLYQDAAVWVFIAAFTGLAIAWASGGVAPWVGAFVGGGVAYLVAALVIASRG